MKIYAVKHKDKNVVANSRSGGVFTAISDEFITSGAVYGCIMNKNLEAVHIRSTSALTRDKMRGSKYVQSKIGGCFRQVKKDLDGGIQVLFTGTSCQIAGLKAFLTIEYENLLCVDIACHGVPSPKVWKSYLSYQGDVMSVDFRNKRDFGWRDHTETLTYFNKTKNSKIWTNLFYSGNILRPCCYKCPYKSINHPGDITIADYWGIEKAAPEFDDNKGVSLVLINSQKGEQFYPHIMDKIIFKETRIEDSMQRAFIRPEYRPKTRDQFWNDFYNKPFKYIAKKYGGQTSLLWRDLSKLIRNIKSTVNK